MRTFHCEACRLDTLLATESVEGGHCPGCGGTLAEVAVAEEAKAYSSVRLEYSEVMASFRRTLVMGGQMAEVVAGFCGGSNMDAVIMTAGVYLYFCSRVNIHPAQFIDMMRRGIAPVAAGDGAPEALS